VGREGEERWMEVARGPSLSLSHIYSHTTFQSAARLVEKWKALVLDELAQARRAVAPRGA